MHACFAFYRHQRLIAGTDNTEDRKSDIGSGKELDYFNDLEEDVRAGSSSKQKDDNKRAKGSGKLLGFRSVDAPVRWFVRLLLEGKVLLGGKSTSRSGKSKSKERDRDSSVSSSSGSGGGVFLSKPDMLRDPSSAVTDMRAIPRITILLREMARHDVASIHSLTAAVIANSMQYTNKPDTDQSTQRYFLMYVSVLVILFYHIIENQGLNSNATIILIMTLKHLNEYSSCTGKR